MRIDAHERRTWVRRLGSRIAPALRSKLSKAPVVVVFYITICLNQAALANAQNQNPTTPVHVQAIQETAETQNEKPKEVEDLFPVKTLGDKLSEQVSALFKTMRNRTKPWDDLKANTLNYDAEVKRTITEEQITRDQLLMVSAKSDITNKTVDTKKVNDQMQSETKSAASAVAFSQLEIAQKFQQGFDFNLDFKKIFGKKNSVSAKPRQGNVRYGLILKEIVPDNNKSLHMAANGSMENDLQYAGHADVKWTIGPISEEGTDKPFQSLNTDDEDENKSWLDRVTPSPVFTNNVKLADTDGYKSVVDRKMPPIVVTVRQEQGLYEFVMTTEESKGMKTKTAEHQLNLPLVGNLSYGRRYNDKFELVRTSLNNILIDKHAPSVNVHYYSQQQRYAAEGVYNNAKDNYTVGVKATGKGNELAPKEDQAEKYEVNFTKTI